MATAKDTANGRRARGTVDGAGLYFSRAVAGGPYVFLASPAVDEQGRLAEEAKVEPPYELSASAQARAQTSYIFNCYKEALDALGSSVNEMVQVEQWIQLKAHADGYLETSRAPGNMERGRPGSALLETGDIVPADCVVNPTGIAVIPGEGIRKEISGAGKHHAPASGKFGEAYAEEPIYNEMVRAGPYLFTVGDIVIDAGYTRGLAEEAEVADFVWWGNEVRSEAQYIFRLLQERLDTAGTSFANAIHSTVYLVDLGDQYEVDLVWRKWLPDPPPARTVTPVRGPGLPRRESVTGHREGAIRFESMFQTLLPDQGAEREVVTTGVEQLGYQSEAIKAGPLLWTSGILAGDRTGLRTSTDTPRQVSYIFDRLRDICEAGGTRLDNLLRIRAFVLDERDGYELCAAMRESFPSDPPCLAITVVPGPLQVSGCNVMLDAVAYVP